MPTKFSASELQERIALARSNLAQLVEQASAYSGAADEELVAQRLANQQETLDALVQELADLRREASARDAR